MSALIVGAAAAVGGAALAAKSANDQKKANAKANDANKAASDEANALNYQLWLESRGLSADGRPVNALLPRYFGATQGVNAAGQKTITGSAIINGNPTYPTSGAPTSPPIVIRPVANNTATPTYAGWV